MGAYRRRSAQAGMSVGWVPKILQAGTVATSTVAQGGSGSGLRVSLHLAALRSIMITQLLISKVWTQGPLS
jgi:hypothetical protein